MLTSLAADALPNIEIIVLEYKCYAVVWRMGFIMGMLMQSDQVPASAAPSRC